MLYTKLIIQFPKTSRLLPGFDYDSAGEISRNSGGLDQSVRKIDWEKSCTDPWIESNRSLPG